jgi:hypothetical protein
LAQRGPIRITVDSKITTPGRIKFYLHRRVLGIPLVNDAIKFLKVVSNLTMRGVEIR